MKTVEKMETISINTEIEKFDSKNISKSKNQAASEIEVSEPEEVSEMVGTIGLQSRDDISKLQRWLWWETGRVWLNRELRLLALAKTRMKSPKHPPLINEEQLVEKEIQVSVPLLENEDHKDQINQQQEEIYHLSKTIGYYEKQAAKH